MASDRITIRLDDTLQEKLDQISRLSGKTQSEVARNALEEFCGRHSPTGSCYELAKRSKLIGAAKDGPGDLSTNKSHFDGFGRA